ncbi:MAG TPA: hypothetical protein PLB91_01060 [Spirochaetales bacterium]|nr:hypothetical protein [Spirochaetales bacterium]
MKLELTEDGFAALNEKIAELQDKASAGIVEPTRAAAILRDVRVDLFGLAQLMKAKIVIAEDPEWTAGPLGA